ncbi:MAG: tRNA uridine(34) 5-carboxymethylaminomethyl modification radical SAM/GNAT enzyme Elp3 [Candidatus Pacearchaeota archaeon]|jgi:elongator complex protein 3
MLKPKKGEVRKPTKTISGITPVAVMLPPRSCEHGSCIYCPNLDVPQSYTPKSPVVLRAASVNYDSYKQVRARIKAFEAMNHKTEKIEIIIMGGTFLEYLGRFQNEFIKGIYDGLNNKKSKTLSEAQKLNEKAKHRCVALCIETRPDKIDIEKMRKWGATRVELGVQIIDNEIYKIVKRGHTVKDVVTATRKLKNSGFKIGYHIMPGLPGANPKKDLKLFKKLFSDSRFRPDQLKVYPCQVMPGSELERLYWDKKYSPYSKEKIEKLLVQMLKLVPRYCRVMRVMREIPPEFLVAGTKRIDLRREIEKELRKKKTKIKEIRYREIGFNKNDIETNLKLKVTKYKASRGEEYFLEIVNKEEILFGLLRLRIHEDKAIIRELHVYGPSLNLGETGILSQHKGIGKCLINEAEKITKKIKIKKLKIISGIGVREYYRKFGYRLKNTYMEKNLIAF